MVNNFEKRGLIIMVIGLLTTTFIALKLLGLLDWSWWYVLILFWIPILLVSVLSAFSFLVAFTQFLIKKIKEN